MVLIKPFTLLPLAVGALAITTHEPVGKRDLLVEARRTCTRTGWIPACPGTYKCVPPGAICCSDGITYAMPPETCPDGQSALTTAPLTMVAPTATATSENIEPGPSVTTDAEITETDVTVVPTITDEVTEVTEATETPTATTEEEETYISFTETPTETETETETGIVSVEPMPTDATTVQTDDVGTASWTLSITAGPGPGPNATVTLGGPTPTGEVVTAAAGRVRLARGLVGLGVVGVVGVLV